MIKVTGVESKGNTVRVTALVGSEQSFEQVFIEYDKITGFVVDSTFNTNSELFKKVDAEVRKIYVFKVPIDVSHNNGYTVREYNQLQDWTDKIRAAETAVLEMDKLISDPLWFEKCGVVSADVLIDALSSVQKALEERTSLN